MIKGWRNNPLWVAHVAEKKEQARNRRVAKTDTNSALGEVRYYIGSMNERKIMATK